MKSFKDDQSNCPKFALIISMVHKKIFFVNKIYSGNNSLPNNNRNIISQIIVWMFTRRNNK